MTVPNLVQADATDCLDPVDMACSAWETFESQSKTTHDCMLGHRVQLQGHQERTRNFGLADDSEFEPPGMYQSKLRNAKNLKSRLIILQRSSIARAIYKRTFSDNGFTDACLIA